MANIVNQYGQVKLGVRIPPLVSPLWNSIFGAWNGEVFGTSLDTNLYSIWDGTSTLSSTNYSTITSSMTHLWKGENNNSDSVGTSNGTTTGALSYGTGLLGTNAFTFNGSSGVNLPNGALDFTGDFTINMWVKPSAFSTAQLIGAYRDNNSGQTCGWYMGILSSGGVFYSESNGTSSKNLNSSNAIKLNTWSLITLTRTSTAIKLYVNGSLVGTTTPTFSILYTSSNGFNTIGYQNYGSARFYFNGSIDEVGTWGRELNSTEILALYNSGTGITHPYSVDSTAAISSYGTSNGALTYGTTFTTGKIGNGYQFNGSSFVDLPAGSLTKTGNFSFSLWVYPTANPSSEKTLISCHDGVKGWMLQYNASGSLILYTQNSGGFTLGSSTITLNAWTHIAVSIEAGVTAKIYVNGVLGNSISGIANITYDNYNQYYLPILGAQRYRSPSSGLAEQRSYFTGKIDGVNIWDKVITADEVVNLYNSGNGAEYPFSTQSLVSYKDAVGTNHGISPASTLTGGVPGPSFTTGKIGKAFNFDGINDYIQLPTNSLNLTGNYSMNLWLYLPSSPNSTLLSVFGNDGTNKGFYIDLTNSNSYTFRFVGFNNGNVTIALNASGNPGYLSRWSMATLTVSGTSVKVYLDGSLVSSGVMSSPINYIGTTYPTLGAFRIGNGSPSGYLANGTKIDALSVWNKELTSNEVTELYNSGNGKQYPN